MPFVPARQAPVSIVALRANVQLERKIPQAPKRLK